MLSSETEQITHGSLGFQEKSDILAVCPPWINWKKKDIYKSNMKKIKQVNQHFISTWKPTLQNKIKLKCDLSHW